MNKSHKNTDQQLVHESREQLLLKILLRLGLKLVTQSPPPGLLVTIALLGVHLVRAVLGKRLLAASSLGRKCFQIYSANCGCYWKDQINSPT